VLLNGDLLIRDVVWPENMGLYYCKVHNRVGSDVVDMFVYPVLYLAIYYCHADVRCFKCIFHLIIFHGGRVIVNFVLKFVAVTTAVGK